jgi:hypothetical protein
MGGARERVAGAVLGAVLVPLPAVAAGLAGAVHGDVDRACSVMWAQNALAQGPATGQGARAGHRRHGGEAPWGAHVARTPHTSAPHSSQLMSFMGTRGGTPAAACGRRAPGAAARGGWGCVRDPAAPGASSASGILQPRVPAQRPGAVPWAIAWARHMRHRRSTGGLAFSGAVEEHPAVPHQPEARLCWTSGARTRPRAAPVRPCWGPCAARVPSSKPLARPSTQRRRVHAHRQHAWRPPRSFRSTA